MTASPSILYVTIVKMCLHLTGGKIVVTMVERYLLDGVDFLKNVEPEMQRLHDEGKWKWLLRKIIPDLGQDPSGKAENGILYVFEVL